MAQPRSGVFALPPGARAVLFALKKRAKKAAAGFWRRVSGWLVGGTLVFSWMASLLAGCVFGIFGLGVVMGVATGKSSLWRSDGWPAGTPEFFVRVAPFLVCAMACAAIRFGRGSLKASLKQRLMRFVIFESEKLEAALEQIRPVLRGEAPWTLARLGAAARDIPRMAVDDFCAFGAGGWCMAGIAATTVLAPFACVAFVFWLIVKKISAAGSLPSRLAAAVATLKEEGSAEFARGERDELSRAASDAQAAVAQNGEEGDERPVRKAPRL